MVPLVVSGAAPAACAAWRSHGEFQVIVRPRGPPLPYDLRVGSWGPRDRVIRHLGVTVVARLDGRRRRTAVVAAVLGGAYLVALTVLSVLSYTGDTRVLAADGTFSSVLGAMTLTPGVLPQITGLMGLVWDMLFFVPIGVFAYLTLPRWAWPLSLLIGPVVAILLQLSAWAAMPGHPVDPVRWLFHSAGSALGVGIAAACSRLVARRRAQAAHVDSTRPNPSLHTPSGAA